MNQNYKFSFVFFSLTLKTVFFSYCTIVYGSTFFFSWKEIIEIERVSDDSWHYLNQIKSYLLTGACSRIHVEAGQMLCFMNIISWAKYETNVPTFHFRKIKFYSSKCIEKKNLFEIGLPEKIVWKCLPLSIFL